MGGQGSGRRTTRVIPHLHADKPGGKHGSETDHKMLETTFSFSAGKLKTQNQRLWKRSVGIMAVGETPSLTGEYIGETYRVLKYPKGTNCLREAREARESVITEQAALFLL